jgi:hypothetical protein
MRVSMLVPLLGLLACRSTTPTLEPEPAPQQPPAVFGEQVQTEPAKPVEALAPITPGVCPAEVGLVPTPFFDERVLVRLPLGLDETNLVESSRTLAEISGTVFSPDCRDEDSEHGALIFYAALTLQLDQDAISLEAARDLALGEFGYSTDFAVYEGVADPNTNRAMWVIEGVADDSRALVVVERAAGFVVVMLFEALAEDWPALVDSFVESGERLLVVPG